MDYFSIAATFSLGGSQQRCFNFISINDNVPELTEIVVVTVSTLGSFGQVLEQRQVFVSILDDDSEKIYVQYEKLDTVNVCLYFLSLYIYRYMRGIPPAFPLIHSEE